MSYVSKLNMKDGFGEPCAMVYGFIFEGAKWVSNGRFLVSPENCRLPDAARKAFQADREFLLRGGELAGLPKKSREAAWEMLRPMAGIRRPVKPDGVFTLADSYLRLSGLEKPVYVNMGYAHPFVGDSISTWGNNGPVYFKRDGEIVAVIMPFLTSGLTDSGENPPDADHSRVEDWLEHHMALEPNERNP